MEEVNKLMRFSITSQEQATRIMESLLAVARPSSVFSQPVPVGAYTVITASEVSAGLGFGYGSGMGSAREESEGPEVREAREAGAGQAAAQALAPDTALGGGGGGGGGGGTMARPVAVISIGPDGVRVEPVVDPTKIALALFTALGAMAMMLGRMRKNRP